MYQALFNNSVAMATVDASWDQFVFKMKGYKHILKVKELQLPIAYRFSTAERKPSLWVDSPRPSCLGLNWQLFHSKLY